MKKNGPFIIKKSVLKYKNPWIEVTEDKVIRPGGKNGIFGIVKMQEGVSVLPMDDKGNVYLNKGFHYAIKKDDIETFSGGIDIEKGESPLKAAKRELKEESGIEAEEWIDLGLTNPFTTVIYSPQRLFLAKKLKIKKRNEKDDENLKIIKIKFKKAVQLVLNSTISHSPSCVLILKTQEFLNKKR
jgi:hypothetical protein